MFTLYFPGMFPGKSRDWPGGRKLRRNVSPSDNGACEAGFNDKVPFGEMSTAG